MAKLLARVWLSHALFAPGQNTAETKKVHETITFLLEHVVTLPCNLSSLTCFAR